MSAKLFSDVQVVSTDLLDCEVCPPEAAQAQLETVKRHQQLHLGQIPDVPDQEYEHWTDSSSAGTSVFEVNELDTFLSPSSRDTSDAQIASDVHAAPANSAAKVVVPVEPARRPVPPPPTSLPSLPANLPSLPPALVRPVVNVGEQVQSGTEKEEARKPVPQPVASTPTPTAQSNAQGAAKHQPARVQALQVESPRRVVRSAPTESVVKVLDTSNRDVSPSGGCPEKSDLKDEWNEVARNTAQMQAKVKHPGKAAEMDTITYAHMRVWLRGLVVDQAAVKESFDDQLRGSSCRCLSRSQGIPHLRQHPEVDLVLWLSTVEVSLDEPVHFRMLRTLHFKITRSRMCPKVGQHWEVLGFSRNPCADLNASGGLLALVHLFYFFSDVQLFNILKALYSLSTDERQGFSLVYVSTTLTCMTVEAFVRGHVSQLCNRAGTSIFESVCNIYASTCYYFYSVWTTFKRTMSDVDMTLKEISVLLHTKPSRLTDALTRGVESNRERANAGKLQYTDMDFGASRGPKKTTDMAKRAQKYRDG